MEETDEAVALRVQKGDAEAFGVLMSRYEAKLMRYARKFLLDPDDAADIVQDVFLKAYENIQSFDASRRFSPWVYRIAHNEFVNDLKKRSSRKTTFTIDFDTLFPTLSAPDTADSAALERDTRATLDRFLDRVDPKYREPLILYYLEEMDYRAIADILHIPVSTVGVRLMRGKTLLQKLAKTEPNPSS
jgi:RNA polymerase sigma-70 factor (ECF subfamily)